MSGRSVDKIVADLLDAVQATSELVERGREAYNQIECCALPERP